MQPKLMSRHNIFMWQIKSEYIYLKWVLCLLLFGSIYVSFRIYLKIYFIPVMEMLSWKSWKLLLSDTVTWSFRIYSILLIWCSRVLIIINVENRLHRKFKTAKVFIVTVYGIKMSPNFSTVVCLTHYVMLVEYKLPTY